MTSPIRTERHDNVLVVISDNPPVNALGQAVRAGLKDAYVEMTCTRGHSPDFARDPRKAINRFIAFALPFSWILTPAERERGLDLAVSHIRLIQPDGVDPTVKNYHWLDLVMGLYDYGSAFRVLGQKGPAG
jgi:branched-chain amino acid aminotransferase